MISTADINKLSVKEKMILLEKLWSSLKQDDVNLTTPSWHKDVLDERRRKLENSEAKFLTLDDLRRSKT